MEYAKLIFARCGNGVGFLDLEIFKQDITFDNVLIPICGAIVGANSTINFSEINQKLVFLQGFNRLKIIPILHQNLLRFQQSHEKSDYLCVMQVKDCLLALCASKNHV